MSYSGEGKSSFLDNIASLVGKNQAETKKTSGSFMEMILSKFGFGEKVRGIQEDAKESRARLFVDIADSVIGKKFPMISSIIDGTIRPLLKLNDAGINADKSTLPWAKEIQSFLAWAQLLQYVPFFGKYYVKAIDKLQHSSTFQAIVNNWPGVTDEMKANISNVESNPKAVLNFLRILIKDLEAGATTISQVLSAIPGLGLNEKVPVKKAPQLTPLSPNIAANDNAGPAAEIPQHKAA